jgi:hypothetical protein
MDIAAWLRGIGLEEYEPAFRDNRIDMRVLRKLTAEDLKDLGVTTIGDRRSSKEKWAEAEIHRVAGEIAMRSPAPDAARAESHFTAALAIARRRNPGSCAPRPTTRGSCASGVG